MKIVAVIQARMGSTRLPGKVLQDIEGNSMLARVVRRARRATGLDTVVVATTTGPADAAVVAECEHLGVPCFRGSEEDVLDRYHRAAIAYGADAVVRITSDCPLLDHHVVDRVIAAFLAKSSDYASNTLQRTFPRGLDIEIMTAAALARAWREATMSYQRSHVTPYIYQNSEMFRLVSITSGKDKGGCRWTVDTPEDLAFVRAVYARLDHEDDFDWEAVLALLAREPELMELNGHIQQKTLEEC